MKKLYVTNFLLLIIAILLVLCACDTTEEPTSVTTYTIQYADDAGTHSISVEDGAIYSIESIPEKYGYDFIGLFDAKEGGVQYVDEKGMSLSAFTDKKNLVLFPQFKAKEYTLILDYQGAAVTGSRSMNVSYGSNINELPMNLYLENKNFMGWYTESNCGGTQIADVYGVLPENAKVTEAVYSLDDASGNIHLYAGFKGVEYTVSFYFGDSGTPEDINVEHGTDISKVIPTTRIDGKAVITWSKSRNDTELTNVFTGKVTNDMILYAAEYAPIIEFNSNGGNDIDLIIAREGDKISLPTPKRENYVFVEWKDTAGNSFEATSMPAASVTLKAVWQAKLVLDENGGNEVEDVSLPMGAELTLPTVERAGYIFAGWYNEDGTKFESTSMPSASATLVARYYKVETKKVVVVSESENIQASYHNEPQMQVGSREIDLSELYDIGIRDVKLTIYHTTWHDMASVDSPRESYISIYSANVASDAYKIFLCSQKHTANGMHQSNKDIVEVTLTGDKLYMCFYGGYYFNYSTTDRCYSYISNVWLEIEYPDMSTLY